MTDSEPNPSESASKSASHSMTESQRRRRSDTWLSVLRQFSRLWGFLLFIVAVVILFRQIALPFVFAVLIAYLLQPIIDRMQPKTGRGVAVILVYLALVGIFVAFFGLLLPAVAQDLARLRDSAPELIARINQEWLPAATQWIEGSFGSVVFETEQSVPASHAMILEPMADGTTRVTMDGLRVQIHETASGGWTLEVPEAGDDDTHLDAVLRDLANDKLAEITAAAGASIRPLLGGTISFLTRFLVTFMLAAFILIDLQRVKGFMRSLVPNDYHGEFDEIMEGADRGLSGVIRGQLMICVVNGALTYLGLLIFGVKYSLLLALLAGVLSLIPIFGTIVSSIPILLIALVSEPGELAIGTSLAMLAWISGIHLLEANFLNPKIIGESAKIHPVVVVFSLLAGESVFGLTGALLAVPVASMIQTIFLFARGRATAFRGS